MQEFGQTADVGEQEMLHLFTGLKTKRKNCIHILADFFSNREQNTGAHNNQLKSSLV